MTNTRATSGSGWTGGSVPGGFSSDGEKTTWAFHAPTGLVTSKTDARGKAVSFTYTSRNELSRRTLARSSGAVYTDFSYDSATGELTGKDYSDSTTDITYDYGRDGQLAEVTDATGTVGTNTTTDYVYPDEDPGTPTPTAGQIDYTTGHEAENLSYDDDGNLTADGAWNFTYDAENRIVQMALQSSTGTLGDCERLEFTYDYLGRRVRKTTFDATSGGSEIADIKFAYDGWNLWAELNANASNAVLRTYTWGPDAAGMIGGAGAAGLLMISSGSDRWFPAYDGRHNVTGLLDQNGNWVWAGTWWSFRRHNKVS